jgi:hypothetical protein
MNRRTRPVAMVSYVLMLGAACAGCGDDDAANSSDDAGTHGHDAAVTSTKDAAVVQVVQHEPPQDDGESAASKDEGLVSEFMADAGDGWKSLIQAHWIVAPNDETYRCARVTVPEDTYVHAFRSLSPIGTHHTVLTVIREPDAPDGLTVCDVGTNNPGGVFGSGVGTNDLTLPDGVGMLLHKGDQLLINLHLFNVRDKAIEGTSGTLVQTMDKDEVEHVADGILAGPIKLDIPPGRNVVQSGDCTMDEDATLISVLAHMHMHGVHMKVVAKSSIDGEVVLHDGDYNFDTQLVYPIDPVRMKKGDVVNIACTYDNMTDQTLHFGDSSLAEMCFAGISRYPASDNPQFLCAK